MSGRLDPSLSILKRYYYLEVTKSHYGNRRCIWIITRYLFYVQIQNPLIQEYVKYFKTINF